MAAATINTEAEQRYEVKEIFICPASSVFHLKSLRLF
jgi:hypothetical protein